MVNYPGDLGRLHLFDICVLKRHLKRFLFVVCFFFFFSFSITFKKCQTPLHTAAMKDTPPGLLRPLIDAGSFVDAKDIVSNSD